MVRAHGFSGTMKYFAGSGIPAPLAVLPMAAEFLGPLGLAVGGAWSLDGFLAAQF